MNETDTMQRPKRFSTGEWPDGGIACPPANIFAKPNEYVIELEMPGVNKEGLEITVEGNELTITGRPAASASPGELIYSESSGRDFRRSFELSGDVDPNNIRAELVQGVVCIHLPKAEKMKPRKVQIEG